MRVDGQGMTVDFAVLHSDISRPAVEQGQDKEKDKARTEEGTIKKISVKSIQTTHEKVKPEDVEMATEVLNKAMKIFNYHLEFKLHEKSGHYQVKVVDSESQEVIREIPQERALDYAVRVREMLDKMVGLLVDEKA